MDEENEPEKHGLAAEGYGHEDSRCWLNSGLYFDENLEKGLGSGDISSILYYGLNSDSGGLDVSALGESKDVLKGEKLAKMPSEDGALDLFSSIGLSNALEDYFWDFDVPKKFPNLDPQLPQESESWNSSMVSQSSGSSKNAFGVSELPIQVLECQNNLPERLTTSDISGNYMTPFVWDLLRKDETGVNSSYSHDPQHIGDVKSISSPVDTSESYHCSNNGYSGTSFSVQSCDASLLDEGTKAGEPSLQGLSTDKPTSLFDLQEFSEVSPMDTNESYNCSEEVYVASSHDLNKWVPLDENTKADDPSSIRVLINKPEFSCDLDETLELQSDHHTLQGVSLYNLLDIDRTNIVASPMETRDSYHGSNGGCIGIAHEVDLMGKSFNSMFMEFTDPSLDDEDKEADDPLLQGLLISNPQGIDEPKSVASPVGTSESHDHSSDANISNSNKFDFNPQGFSCNSVCIKETIASPGVEDTEEDDPTLQSILMKKRAKCRKKGPHKKQKRVQNPIQRCNNDLPALKTKSLRRRNEERTNSSKRKHVEAKSQSKGQRKRVNDTTLVAHDVLPKKSRKQDVDSDDEYDPFKSNMKSGSARNGNDGRKDNRNWTLSEVIKLVDGVSKFGVGKWTAIQKTFSGSPPCRTSLDIRDKWRNLIRTSALRLKHMKEEEPNPKCGSIQLPKSLLEKICELDRVQPYLRSVGKGQQKRRHDLVDSSSD